MLKGAKSIFLDAWRAFILTFGPFLVHSDYFFVFFLGTVHSERQLQGVQPGVPGHAKPLEHAWSPGDLTCREG